MPAAVNFSGRRRRIGRGVISIGAIAVPKEESSYEISVSVMIANHVNFDDKKIGSVILDSIRVWPDRTQMEMERPMGSFPSVSISGKTKVRNTPISLDVLFSPVPRDLAMIVWQDDYLLSDRALVESDKSWAPNQGMQVVFGSSRPWNINMILPSSDY